MPVRGIFDKETRRRPLALAADADLVIYRDRTAISPFVRFSAEWSRIVERRISIATSDYVPKMGC
jgi:hypothetical protein